MTIYAKLNAARAAFHKLELKKSGFNKFSEYRHFELGDFLIPAMTVLAEHGLCAYVSFEKDLAHITVCDTESSECFCITSPMGSAALKGCHEVQNIGAVQTYQRRYLWSALLEIVEHDAVDSGPPAANDIDLSGVKTLDELKARFKALSDADAERCRPAFTARHKQLRAA
ncbi:Essential recombination function protein [uncultured Caudovirales phage]|uniref:Essential recombination function protein n=1 Tax=uncultured Caudovirales phage TaxID=2100421 RepID=A0A6J5KU89_9CAUD|nr:Essential recombination function protein [uncultured Caudovirales phage]CAB5195074.1 Essential recombination function protein [uncultured Caudovirales phage]